MRKKSGVIVTLILVLLMSCMVFASAETEAASGTITDEPSESTEVPGDAYRGDANGDGRVTAVDARLILRHTASLENLQGVYVFLADVDGNGRITASDARIALRMSANLVSLFTYSENYHAHDYDVTVIKAATCTEDGMEKRVCRICGQETEVKTNAKGHSFTEATCQKPKTCKVCGYTEGTATGHHFSAATCQVPKTCTNCGYTEGTAIGHQFSEASCYAPATCKMCGITTGSFGHHFNRDGKCTVCGKSLVDINNRMDSVISAYENGYKKYVQKSYSALENNKYASYLTNVIYAFGPMGLETVIDACGDDPDFADAKAYFVKACDYIDAAYQSISDPSGNFSATAENALTILDAQTVAMEYVNQGLDCLIALAERTAAAYPYG